MNPDESFQWPPPDTRALPVASFPMAESVVEVYEAAPPVVRSRMLTQLVVTAFESAPLRVRRQLLERLIRPLGLLSLAAVAGGIFAKIRLRSGWQELQVQLEDVQNVNAGDLAALVDHVQQVSVETVAGIARLIAASPWMAGSAIAAVLLTVLMRHARMAAPQGDDDEDLPGALPGRGLDHRGDQSRY